MHVGEPEVAALGAERESLVVEAEAVQDRGLQVVHMHLVPCDMKAQLVGLTVMRDGTPVGTVSRVDHFPAQDLLVVATDKGEVMVPFVSAIVPAVDIAAKTVTVTPPGGLFEDLDDDSTGDDDVAAETANQEGVNEETADNAD